VDYDDNDPASPRGSRTAWLVAVLILVAAAVMVGGAYLLTP
jgi:hypothetical protein